MSAGRVQASKQLSHKKVKILILTNEKGDISANIQSQLDRLSKELNHDEYEIKYQKEMTDGEREKRIADVINDGDFDVVLIDENISSSAWKIVDQCSKARFYIGGEVGRVVKREMVAADFSGVVRIDKYDAEGKPQPLVSEVTGDANRSAANPIPNTIETRFCIGSTTKMLTAVAVVTMAEKMKLDPLYATKDIYHIPIKDILEQFNPAYPNKDIFKDFTLHELLTHTSGIGGGIEEPVLKTDMIKIEGLEGYLPWVLKALGEKEEIEERRGEYCYSNAGIVLLGFAIEAMTGINYYDYVRENILKPVGMVHTKEKRQSGDPDYSISYEEKLPPPSSTQMQWLNDVVNDNKSPIQKFAVLLKDLQKHTDEFKDNQLAAEDLMKEYQTGLLEHQDKESFSDFRDTFSEKLKEFYSHCDQDKYISRIGEIKKLSEELNKWIKENEGKPGCEDAKKLRKEILEPIKNNFEWPVLVIQSLIINLSISHPAGKLFSTADDMTAFQNALWISKGILAKYSEILCPPDETENNEYGYGTMVFNENKIHTPGYGHLGGAGGAWAKCISYRDPGFTAVTCSNDNKAPFRFAEQLDKFLMFGSDRGIQYLDQRVHPNLAISLVEDIRRIQKICVLILSSSDKFTDDSIKQLNGCDCLVITASGLSTDKLLELYKEHKPDMIVFDGKAVSSASICHDFNAKLSTSIPRVQCPRLYLDTSQAPQLVPQYFRKHKVCGTVSYTDVVGEQITYRGQLSPGSDKPAKKENNYNVASASKLFTVLACYFALNGKINEPVKIHPDIKLPKYIREKIGEGVTAEQLMFHQAGMGNYLMKILEMVKSGVPVPIPVIDPSDPLIPLPIIGDKSTLSEHAHTFLEGKLNMVLSEQQYSNTGYYVLGLVIETAINEGKNPSDPDWKSFYQYVHEKVLADRMPNTSHIQTDKSISSPQLDELLKGQQLPCTAAGCWYSTADDQYRMMQWVYEKYKTDKQFKEFIDYYNQHHPLRESKDPDEFMHVGRLDTGANAYVSLNLKTGSIYCIVTNEANWEVSGMQHIVTRESITDAALAVAKSKGLELDVSHQPKKDSLDDTHGHTESPRM